MEACGRPKIKNYIGFSEELCENGRAKQATFNPGYHGMASLYRVGQKNRAFSYHHIDDTDQGKNGFHQNILKVCEKEDYCAVFMELLNILCKLAYSYYTQNLYF